MPLPKPGDTESRVEFLSRCMGNETMVRDFEKAPQRYAVCISQWTRRNKSSEDQSQDTQDKRWSDQEDSKD